MTDKEFTVYFKVKAKHLIIGGVLLTVYLLGYANGWYARSSGLPSIQTYIRQNCDLISDINHNRHYECKE